MHDCSNDDSGLQLAKLKVEASWESHGLREDFDITLVTQMSPKRAHAMKHLCRLWAGIISAAVYVPLLQGSLVPEEGVPKNWTVPDVIAHLSAFHREMDTHGPCKLDMVLYSEEVESETMAAFYPVNALRNRALKQAKTEIVLLDDVDFIVSGGLSDEEAYADILQHTRQGLAVVMPAFEPVDALGIGEGRKTALKAVHEGKATAVDLFNRQQLKPFHIERWDLAHRATDYAKWTTASSFYDVQYEHDFEPYILLARDRVPPYDERLRGYFENKAVHVRHLATTGVKFVVHPTGYVVHLPHRESRARLMIIDPANTAIRDKVQGLGTVMRQWIDEGTYTPVTTDACSPEQLSAAAARYVAKAAAAAATSQGQQASGVSEQGSQMPSAGSKTDMPNQSSGAVAADGSQNTLTASVSNATAGSAAGSQSVISATSVTGSTNQRTDSGSSQRPGVQQNAAAGVNASSVSPAASSHSEVQGALPSRQDANFAVSGGTKLQEGQATTLGSAAERKAVER